jgi:hypothetical protein
VAANKPLTMRVRITGVHETLAAFRNLPKDATVELREAAGRIAERIAVSARAAGMSSSAQSALVAPSVRVARDRVPVVQVGGAGQVGRRNTPMWKILFGAEFGARSYRQFRRHRGAKGYWFFSTIEGNEGQIAAEWNKAADTIISKWGAGG